MKDARRGIRQQFKYHSQFIYRYVFALLLFLYVQHQGIVEGFLSRGQIATAILLYILAVAGVHGLARGRRLSDPQQRFLVVLDLMAMTIGVPHDPNQGLPTLFVFYLAYADLGLRYRFQLYVESLFLGILAIGLMLYLRAEHTVVGLAPPDLWQAFLLFIIVLHGLQVFSGRDRARRALQESEGRLQLALATPGVAAWSSPDPLRLLKVDGQMRAALGMDSREDLAPIGEYIERIHPEDRARVVARYSEFVRSADSEYEDEYRVLPLGGEVRHMLSRAHAIRDDAQRQPRVAGMLWDITVQKTQAEALERKTRELEISNQELDDFTYIASHDLKEPLRAIRNYARFLEQDYARLLDEPGRHMLAKIQAQGERMETLIRELLNIARISRSEAQREPVELQALVEDLLNAMEFQLREKGVSVRLPTPLPVLNCDRVRVTELFRNLLVNAVKYNDKAAPWVEISTRQQGGELVLQVRDNGIGIPAEYQTRIFNLFERLHGQEDAYGGGTGVGLSIVEKTVQLHGGRLWVESEPGQGSTFCFTLPAENAL